MSRGEPARTLVVAAVLVDDLQHPGRLLAARRRTPPELAGRWEFPGGKVHPGEAARDALRRELAEELQISVTLGAELPGPPEGDLWPISAAYEMRLWFAAVSGGVATITGGHDELRWLTFAELGTVLWLEADQAVAALLTEMFRPF